MSYNVNVAYRSCLSIDGVIFPYSACNLQRSWDYNVTMPLRSVGPVAYSTGPTKISGSITLPVFASWNYGSHTFESFKELMLLPIERQIVVDYGYDAQYMGGDVRHVVQYDRCIIKSTTIACQPGGYTTCTFEIGAQRSSNIQSFNTITPFEQGPDVYAPGDKLVTFLHTGVESSYAPWLVPQNVCGWSFTVTRDWVEYWGWNNSNTVDSAYGLVWDDIEPGAIYGSGQITLLQSQSICNPNTLVFNIGLDLAGLSNFIRFEKVLFKSATPPIGNPDDRILQTMQFICISDGVNGMTYANNGIAS